MISFFVHYTCGFRVAQICEEVGHNTYRPIRYEVRCGGTTLGKFETLKEADAYCAAEEDRRAEWRRQRRLSRKKWSN